MLVATVGPLSPPAPDNDVPLVTNTPSRSGRISTHKNGRLSSFRQIDSLPIQKDTLWSLSIQKDSLSIQNGWLSNRAVLEEVS